MSASVAPVIRPSRAGVRLVARPARTGTAPAATRRVLIAAGLAAAALAAAAPGAVWAGQPPAVPGGDPAGAGPLPRPPGALRVVSTARRAGRVAICAEEAGAAAGAGAPAPARGAAHPAGRPAPRTRIWIGDGTTFRRAGIGPGACDPAWSPTGDRVAVVAPDGLWVLSADLRRVTHLVDTRRVDGPRPAFERRTLHGPRWAPDASALAFIVDTGRTSWVEVIDARTGARRYASDPDTDRFSWGEDAHLLRVGSRMVRLPPAGAASPDPRSR